MESLAGSVTSTRSWFCAGVVNTSLCSVSARPRALIQGKSPSGAMIIGPACTAVQN